MEVSIKKVDGDDIRYTTSTDVAKTFGKSHQHVLRDIRKLGCSERFRSVHFWTDLYEDEYGREQIMYGMDYDGFSILVMGYKGPKAMEFKEEYIDLFNRMATEIKYRNEQEQERAIARAQGKTVRRTLTDAIMESGEDERMHGHAYPTYTDLVYRAVFGMVAKKLRAERNVKSNEALRNTMSADELNQIMKVEALIVSLLDYGKIYDDIKLIVLPQEALPAPSRKALPAGEESTGKKATGKKRGRKKALAAAGA